MAAGLSQAAFSRLLDYLDEDRQRAGEKYEDLRRTLRRFFEWRNLPFPDESTDETLDRLARRLSEGVEVQNVGAYCRGIAQLVLSEQLKAHRRTTASLDAAIHAVTFGARDADVQQAAGLDCLDSCLAQLTPDSRALIVDYYSDHGNGRIAARKLLAARLGINTEAVANRAQRLRDKLEQCVRACLRHQSGPPATKS